MLGTHVTLFFSREVWRYVSFGMLVPILRVCVTNRNGVAMIPPHMATPMGEVFQYWESPLPTTHM